MKHKVIDEVWKARRATYPKAIARVLTSTRPLSPPSARNSAAKRSTPPTDAEVFGLDQGDPAAGVPVGEGRDDVRRSLSSDVPETRRSEDPPVLDDAFERTEGW